MSRPAHVWGEPWRFTSTEPTENVLVPLLAHLRPLVVLGESVNLRATFDICEPRLTSDDHRRGLREGRLAWKACPARGSDGVDDQRARHGARVRYATVDGLAFPPNGPDAQELRSVVPEGRVLTRHMFLDHVYRAIECVIWTPTSADPSSTRTAASNAWTAAWSRLSAAGRPWRSSVSTSGAHPPCPRG